MNNAFRAAIASALLFPGAGLFLLHHYVRGLIFAAPAVFIISVLFLDLMKVASALSAKLAANEISFDFFMLSQQLHNAIFISPYWDTGKWILLASWSLSILSSYYVGRKIDLDNSPS